MKKIILALVVMLMPLSASAFEIDGFKQYKFGASFNELAQNGFKATGGRCTSAGYSCYNYDISETFLGFRVTGVSTVKSYETKTGVVDGYSVTVSALPLEVIKTINNALGVDPITYTYRAGLTSQNRINVYAWTSSEGNSIVIKHNLDAPKFTRNLFGRLEAVKDTYVKYYGPVLTNEMLKQAKANTIKFDKKDF